MSEENSEATPEEQSGLFAIDYSDYGRYGPILHRIRKLHWESTAAKWQDERRQQIHGEKRLLPFWDILEAMNPSVFWFIRMRLATTKLAAFSQEGMAQFWNEKFRWIFRQPLEEYSVLANSAAADQCDYLLQIMAQIVNAGSPELDRLYESKRGVSFSAFTRAEIEYLRNKSVVEFGCYSGYLLSMLGEDALGIDNDEERISRIAISCAWTRELLDSNRLIFGGPKLLRDQKYANRTLVGSWFSYGRRGPVEALEKFTKAGGQSLVLKYGVYVDWRVIDDLENLPSAGVNFRRFMTILADHWREAPPEGQPEYNPLALGDNMWCFVRRQPSA